MSAPRIWSVGSLWILLRDYPLLSLGRWLTRKPVPWFLRRLGIARAAMPGTIHPYLFTLGEREGLADTLEAVPPGAIVQVPQWFVGTLASAPGDNAMFVGLTQLYSTPERAERARMGLESRYPGAASFGIVSQFDTADPRQYAALRTVQRRALRGDR